MDMAKRWKPIKASLKDIKITKDLFTAATEVLERFKVPRFLTLVPIFAKMDKIPIIHVRIFNETPSRIFYRASFVTLVRTSMQSNKPLHTCVFGIKSPLDMHWKWLVQAASSDPSPQSFTRSHT